MDDIKDVVVVGGGAAGLRAGLILARSRRSVLVVDAGEPRNAPAGGVHAFLTRDGLPPRELQEIGRREVEGYGGVVVTGLVTSARAVDGGFEVEIDGSRRVRSRRLIVTTGLTDELPDVPGLREHWGSSVVHCPFCHGWEVRDRAIAVLGTTAFVAHQALLFRQLSDDVTVFTHTAPELPAEERARLVARGVRIVEGEVVAVEGSETITGLRLADGTVVPRDVVTVTPRFVANSSILADLGLKPEVTPMGERIPTVDMTGRTAVPGVWVAGNVTDLMGQVVAAAAAGNFAGAAVNGDLVDEEARRAVEETTA